MSRTQMSIVVGQPDQLADLRERAARITRACTDLATEAARLAEDVALLAEQPSERPILIGVEEAAALIRVSRSTMFALVRDEQVASIKVGTRRLVPIADLERFASGQPRVDAAPAAS